MLSIPVSVVSTFAFMSFAGVSLNIMSIGGMALGVGMLVDCSIVVLEAIHRKREQLEDIFEATVSAVKEVGASVISGTLTTLVVLVPILFMSGIAQRLFRDFAFTMGGSLWISLLVSILLLPAIIVSTRSSKQGPSAKDSKGTISGMESYYRILLALALNRPVRVIGTCVVLFGAAIIVIYQAGFELLPRVDVGRFNVNVTLPAETNLDTVEKTVDRIESWIHEFPQVMSYVTEVGAERNKGGLEPSQETGKPNEAKISIKLNPEPAFSGTTEQIVGSLRQQSEGTQGTKVDFILNQGPLARILGTKDSPELFSLAGDDLEELSRSADRLTKMLEGKTWLKDVYCDGNVWTDHLRVIVERYKASAEGISVDDIAQAVRNGIEGKVIGKFITGDQEQDIRVRLKSRDSTTVDDVNSLPMRNQQERVVPVGRIANVNSGRGPREILRTDKRRNIVFHGNVTGIAISRGEEQALEAAQNLNLGSGHEIGPGVARFEMMESIGGLFTAVALASMLVYAILVVQFESLVWPFVVFTAAPISIVGPAIALYLRDSSVNVLVLIGAVVLVGIVVNMAILMVATINDLRKHGSDLRKAVIDGSATRLRPILMTTATTALGAMPICVAHGAADQLNKPLAITIVAGLLASALFKLFGLPIVYELVGKTRFGAIVQVKRSQDSGPLT